ncbi:CCA tRNA nucleotidyltransferase [Xinfangfangia sp. D13-10-4-6]|uniref:CCA tRNA nucleotidyltransferase n=1 Tax=Pseudogemmobacter hezensis TaxID=2737662 RepID=UPI001551F1E0|nr:CCA tRNA nucleotidyltransferase [Pseudogemmobacter hezensis]NPD15410.1 CCA tRNA nucleotidyltransferase [Pseudogemmobacter hezensis]
MTGPERISGDWLTGPEITQVFALLQAGGHQVYAVGGCVRDALLGARVNDIDLSTNALPTRVTELARAAGLTTIPTGIDHGTVTVLAGGIPFEITTWRRDVETDGRRAVVAFAERIEDDAMRRDFTMNALYAAPDGRLLDPLGGGITDAHARHIRFIGTPEARIREDYLRILRFFRFYAWFGDAAEGPDPEGLAACAALAEGLDTISRERVGAELKKLLSAPDPAPSLAAMQASGVLTRVLPGADARAMALLVHLEEGLSPAPTPAWPRRLALLSAAMEGVNLTRSLRLSREEGTGLAQRCKAVQDGGATARLGQELGAGAAQDAILARAALLETPPPQGFQAEIARGAAAVFPVTAADLMPEFSGPALGERMRVLREAWLAADLRPGKEALLALP